MPCEVHNEPASLHGEDHDPAARVHDEGRIHCPTIYRDEETTTNCEEVAHYPDPILKAHPLERDVHLLFECE